jgi:hypothetical protein
MPLLSSLLLGAGLVLSPNGPVRDDHRWHPGANLGHSDVALTLTDSSDAPRLWYRQPATTWNQALPVGNGRLGAMVFGGRGR